MWLSALQIIATANSAASLLENPRYAASLEYALTRSDSMVYSAAVSGAALTLSRIESSRV